jgi:hypothetical protein
MEVPFADQRPYQTIFSRLAGMHQQGSSSFPDEDQFHPNIVTMLLPVSLY